MHLTKSLGRWYILFILQELENERQGNHHHSDFDAYILSRDDNQKAFVEHLVQKLRSKGLKVYYPDGDYCLGMQKNADIQIANRNLS